MQRVLKCLRATPSLTRSDTPDVKSLRNSIGAPNPKPEAFNPAIGVPLQELAYEKALQRARGEKALSARLVTVQGSRRALPWGLGFR